MANGILQYLNNPKLSQLLSVLRLPGTGGSGSSASGAPGAGAYGAHTTGISVTSLPPNPSPTDLAGSLAESHKRISQLTEFVHRAQDHLVAQLDRRFQAGWPFSATSAVTGVQDPTGPKGASTNGITIAAGASLNVAHGLDRAPIGLHFLAVAGGGPIAMLQDDSHLLTKDIQAKQVRVTNSGAAPVTFKMVVV